MIADLVFRKEDFADPARRGPLLDLLRDIFSLDLAAYSARNVWHPGYRAFSYWSEKSIAANVSIRPLPLMVSGTIVKAAQLHAVATRPQWRRRGLFADLMTRVLEYAAGRFDALLLFTAEPLLYQPFGFRHQPQHLFAGCLAADAGGGDRIACRDLSLNDPDDATLMLALYAARQPVSRSFAVTGNGDVFLANALLRPAWRFTYLPRLHALIVSQGARLLDIAAPQMPPMAAIQTALAAKGGREIEIHFPPDLLAGDFQAIPFSPPEGDHLMLRGSLDFGGRPVILPPTALA